MLRTKALSTFWMEMWACSGVDLDTVTYRNISYSYRKGKHDTLVAQPAKQRLFQLRYPGQCLHLLAYFASGATGRQRSACGTIDWSLTKLPSVQLALSLCWDPGISYSLSALNSELSWDNRATCQTFPSTWSLLCHKISELGDIVRQKLVHPTLDILPYVILTLQLNVFRLFNNAVLTAEVP